MASNTASEGETLVLPIDWKILDASNGLAFDIGGSVIKLAYIAKETWIEPADRKQGSKGCLHVRGFSREDIEEAFEFINKEVKLSKPSSEKEFIDIYATGFGSAQFSDKFKKEIKANNTALIEMDCFVKAFLYLVTNMPGKDILQPNPQNIYDVLTEEVNKMAAIFTMTKLSGQTVAYNGVNETKLKDGLQFPRLDSTYLEKPLSEIEDLFPCILTMIGSGNAAILVNKDGSFLFVDGCTRGGSYLRGLGSLLCGTKTHAEFLKLCESGRLGNVTMTTSTIQKKMQEGDISEKEDVYSKFATGTEIFDQPMYTFGMAPGKNLSEFKREDLAVAAMHAVASDMVQSTHSCAVIHGAKHVFFAGGVVSDPVVRKMFLAEWLRRDAALKILNTDKREHIQAHFMKHAQTLGAIGAFLNGKSQQQTASTS